MMTKKIFSWKNTVALLFLMCSLPVWSTEKGWHNWDSSTSCPNIPVYAPFSASDIPFLEEHGRTLETFPNLPAITIGGAVATAAHGTSFKQGTISGSVVGVEVAPNLLKHIELGAFATNVGKLGVITKLYLRTIPSEILTQQVDIITTNDFFKLWNNLIKNNLRLQAWYDFQSQTVLVLRYHHPDDNFPALSNTNATSFFIRKAEQVRKTSKGTLPKLMLATNLEPRLEAEYAVNQSQAITAIKALQNFIKEKQIPISRPMLIRFGGIDHLPWLSPANSSEGVVFLNIDVPPGQQLKLDEVEKFMIEQFNARPHWGKYHSNRKELMEKAYGNKLAQFEQYQGVKLRQLFGCLLGCDIH